jgi:hypothetical protein
MSSAIMCKLHSTAVRGPTAAGEGGVEEGPDVVGEQVQAELRRGGLHGVVRRDHRGVAVQYVLQPKPSKPGYHISVFRLQGVELPNKTRRLHAMG